MTGLICTLGVLSSFLTTTLTTVVVVVLTYAAVSRSRAATSAYIADITRRARYGSAHGVFGTIHDIGDALGPIAAGALVASLGFARMSHVMAIVAIMMAIVFAVGTARHSSHA